MDAPDAPSRYPRRSCWGFVPFIDFTNCRYMESQDSSRTVYELTTNSVVMRATESYAAGTQLFENYGWSNHAYMLAHGFILPDHPKDSLHLPSLLLPIHDESRHFLLTTILGENWNDNHYSVVLGREVDAHVLAVIHIVHMSDESVQSIMRMLVDRQVCCHSKVND